MKKLILAICLLLLPSLGHAQLSGGSVSGGNGTASAISIPNPNLLQNGGMVYDRRKAGAVSSLTGSAGGTNADRWPCSLTTGTSGLSGITVINQNTSTALTNLVRSQLITIGATPSSTHPSNLLFNCNQAIEGPDVADLGFGKSTALPVTVSMWAKASVAMTYGVSLRANGATRSYVHDCVISSINTWTQCVFTAAGDTTGTWLTAPNTVGLFVALTLSAGSGAQAASPDTWLGTNSTATANTSFYTDNANATFEFTGTKAERGTGATSYVEEPAPIMLTKLAHFYQTSAPIGTAPADNIAVAGATCIENPIAAGQPSTFVYLQPPLFAAPTIATFNPSAGAAGNWRNVTASSDIAASVDPATAKSVTGFEIGTAATTATIGQTLCIHWSADSGR